MAAKEMKEVVQFVVGLVKAGGDAMADGKVTLADALGLFSAFQLAPAAFEGVAKLPAELSAWTDADKAMIFAEVEKLDLPNDMIEQWAERILKTAVTLAVVVTDYVKALKA